MYKTSFVMIFYGMKYVKYVFQQFSKKATDMSVGMLSVYPYQEWSFLVGSVWNQTGINALLLHPIGLYQAQDDQILQSNDIYNFIVKHNIHLFKKSTHPNEK